MRACGVNFPDALLIADQYQIAPAASVRARRRDRRRGQHASAKACAILKAGDRVLAMPGWNGMAQLVKVAATACTRLPDSMSFEHAATLMATYGTVHYALSRRARLKSGESLLVLGAAGGIGLAAWSSVVRPALASSLRSRRSRNWISRCRVARRRASCIRPARRRATARRCRSSSRSRSARRASTCARSGRRRLRRAGAALDRVGRPLSRDRLRRRLRFRRFR